MTILKLLGVFLILGAGGLAATYAVRYEKRKISVLAGWSELILYIRSQVDCYLLPLPQILERADVALFGACFCRDPHPDLTGVFHASQSYLDTEARRLLASFVREFGYEGRAELLRRSDYYVAELGRLRAKRLEELTAKTRVIYAVCMGAAILISILLW